MPPKNPAKSIPGEADFIARARAGDKDSYRHLVEGYQDRVFALSLSMVRNREQAEDLTQEIFVKAFFALESFKGDSAFFTWLYRISSNTCLDYLRKNRLPEISLDNTLEEEGDITRLETISAPASDRPEAAIEGDLSLLLGLITPEQRLILTLREVDGYAYEEIAEILKCAVNTVKSRINRAREALKKAYQDKYGQPEGNNLSPNYVEKSEEKR